MFFLFAFGFPSHDRGQSRGTSLEVCLCGMRKRHRVLLLLVVVGLVAVRLGFALSVDDERRVRVAAQSQDWPFMPECAELALAGGLLFGAAALVRKAG
jgi:hypothetical protein